MAHVSDVDPRTGTDRICEIVESDIHHVGVDHVAYDGTVCVEFGADAAVPSVMGQLTTEGWGVMTVDFDAREIRFAPCEMLR